MFSTPYLITRGGRKFRPSWDFTTLTPGGVAVPTYLSFSRASVASVQTSASTVDTTLTTNQLRAKGAGSTVGLLLEASRTNYNSWSRVFTNAGSSGWWTNPIGTVTADQATGPDGTASIADRIQNATNQQGPTASGSPLNPSTKSCISFWVRAVSGTSDFQVGNGPSTTGLQYLKMTGIGTTWQRAVLPIRDVPAASYGSLSVGDSRNLGSGTTGAIDVYLDLFQSEIGEYPTSVIVSVNNTPTRAADKLSVTDAVMAHLGGRVDFNCKLKPLGASTEYDTDGPYVTLWSVDSGDRIRVNTSTLEMNVTIGGTTWIPSTALPSWSRDDTYEFSVSAGGNALQSVAKVRKNGGSVTTLGTSGAPQPVFTRTGNLYLLTNSGGTESFSAEMNSLSFDGVSAWAA